MLDGKLVARREAVHGRVGVLGAGSEYWDLIEGLRAGVTPRQLKMLHLLGQLGAQTLEVRFSS
jgi:hypothetical protein